MNEENKKETSAPPSQDGTEDVYNASTRVGQAPAEILELIAKAEEPKADSAGPPKVLIKTPPAMPVTDFSIPESTRARAAVVPESLTSGLLDDDDWVIPAEAAKAPPSPPRAAPRVPPPAPPATVPVAFAPLEIPPEAVSADALDAALAPYANDMPPPPPSRPVTPRADFAPLSSRPRTPRVDFAPVSTSLLGLAPTGVPEERASARKLLAAAPDPNVRVSRVDEEIFSVRSPPVEGEVGADENAPGSAGGGAPMSSGVPREAVPAPQLGDPMPPSGNPNHLPIADAPNSMHVPIGEAKGAPSRTPVGAIVALGVVLMLLALGGIVFAVLK